MPSAGKRVTAVLSTADTKQSIRAATTASITLSGLQTVDGVSLVADDRCLVKDQTNAAENGIYSVATGSWIRASDANSIATLSAGAAAYIEEGTDNSKTLWVLVTISPITIGITALFFEKFSGRRLDRKQTDRAGFELPPVTTGQTSFTLTKQPADGADVVMTVNGQEQVNGINFSVSGNILTWLAVNFSLEASDDVKIDYDT